MKEIKYKSKYTIEYLTIDGNECVQEFVWHQQKVLSPQLRPHNQSGIIFIKDDKQVFIPWHQIKVSTLSEEIIGEEPV